MFQALKDLTEETKRLQKQIEERGKAALLDASKALLDQFPAVQKIYWTQYTPYFNDGEACYFRVNSVHALMKNPEKQAKYEAEKRSHEDKQATAKALSEEQRKKLGIELEEWIEPDLDSLCDEEYVSSYSADKKRAKYGPVWDAIVQLSEWVEDSANKDTLETVFGDHVQVCIARAGVTVEEYEHE
jgi:hypothetical protein